MMAGLGDVAVLGLGASGEAAASYCAGLLGTACDSVTVIESSDSQFVRRAADRLEALGVRVLLGKDAVPGCYDLCIASPGIPPHSPLMRSAQNRCAEVISEVEFAYRRSNCSWVAITGTNGKTTTTSLVVHLLGEAGIPARAVGNIGVPAISAVAQGCDGEVLVAEVSSFQLALTSTFRPRVAVLLNITPDHIDWHGSFDRYAADKARIFANLGVDDLAVIDVDDEGSAGYADSVSARGVRVVRVSARAAAGAGALVENERLTLVGPHGGTGLCSVADLRIRGSHNVSNALAGAVAAHAMGAGFADLTRGLASFEPVEHRLEPVGYVCGLEWFNDSKATNPDAVFKAVAAFGDRPYVLLLGGRNKGNDFRSLASRVAQNARAVILFGEAAEELATAFQGTGVVVQRAAGLTQAVSVVARHAVAGDAVLLSPACASFDEFTGYEERGREFKRLVSALHCEVSQ